MKNYNLFFLFLLCFFIGCKAKEGQIITTSENNIDAARNFIRAALDGKFDEARNFMLEDSSNINYMDVVERSFSKADYTVKEGYRTSSINIRSVTELNDSVTVVIYSNSYKNDHDTLRVVKQSDRWLVDLKYLYEHDEDANKMETLLKDSTNDK